MKALQLINNQKGMAIIEAIPLLVIFVMLLSFSLGFYGVIQTAVLNNISARAYAFETFRSRTNLNYFREDGSALNGQPGPLYLGLKGFRYHAVQNKNDSRGKMVPTPRTIALSGEALSSQTSVDIHNNQIDQDVQDGRPNQKIDVNPVWIMVGYGLCLNAACNGQ